MFVINVEGAVLRKGKWLLIERSDEEEHAGGLLAFVGGRLTRLLSQPIYLNKPSNVRCLRK